MFASISLANPNSTVTSSFKAIEACQVGVGEGYTVRVNGQEASSRPINLVLNDIIELDVMSPPGAGYKFVPWTYNGLESYFAVVSKQDNNKATLKGLYRNKLWSEFPVTLAPKWSYNNGTEVPANTNGTSSGTQTTDLVVLMNPVTGVIHYIRNDNARIYAFTLPVRPLAHTRMFNGANRAWESYFLGVDGFVYYVALNRAVNKAAATIADAKSLWSNGTSLFVGGKGFVKILSDHSTVVQTIVTTETIVYGASVGATTFAISQSGKIYRIDGDQLVPVYFTTASGPAAVFADQIIVPISDEYKLKVYDAMGAFVRDIDCGDRIPMAVTADGNSSFAVSYADSTEVGVYQSVDATPRFVNFTDKVTFAIPSGTAVFADHYLREFVLTAPPNPPVSGVSFPSWTAPIGVDVGSGEVVVSSLADSLQAIASPNAKLLINGLESAQVFKNQDRIALLVGSEEGRKSSALVMGNYAFDFKINAFPSESFTTALPIANKLRNDQVVFNLLVPKYVKDAPVALSHGTLQVNGAAYNGRTPIQEGDILQITINVPANRSSYYSMLSLADSQFALTINTATTTVADTLQYQDYLSETVISTFTVTEAGDYYLPNYSKAKVSRLGVQLQNPIQLAIDDIIEVQHVRMSKWWFDARDTTLMGPNTNYQFRGITAVDDAPDPFDLGYIHLAIPDFPFSPDGQGTISGLSKDYNAVIYGDNLTISVNGGPYLANQSVKNGDVIQVTQVVKNLFDDQYVKTRLFDGREYGFAVFHVDPALGVYRETPSMVAFEPTYWAEVDQVTEITADFLESKWVSYSTPAVQQPGGIIITGSSPTGFAPTSQYETSPTQPDSNVSVASWETSPTQSRTSASKATWQLNATLLQTPSPLANNFESPTPISWDPEAKNTDSRYTYTDFDTVENFISSYGHEVIFRLFDAYWEPFQDITSRSIKPVFEHELTNKYLTYLPGVYYMNPGNFPDFSPVWYNINRGPAIDVDIAGVHDEPNRVWVNDQSGLAAYESQDNDFQISFEPKFVTMQNQLFNQNNPAYSAPDKVFYGYNAPLRAQPAVAVAEGASGWHASDLHWASVTPLTTGGYETVELAQQAGALVGKQLEVVTYKQPEGAFSFVVKRETSLFCEIKTSDLIAGKWLLGGG